MTQQSPKPLEPGDSKARSAPPIVPPTDNASPFTSRAANAVRLEPVREPFEGAAAEQLEHLTFGGHPPLGLFRTLAVNPRVLGRFRRGSLLDPGSISTRTRELMILRTCALCGSEYEWGVHGRLFAGVASLSAEEVTATAYADLGERDWSSEDRLTLELADALHGSGAVPDDLYAELADCFAADQLVELVVLAGFYHTVSFVTATFGVELEASALRFPVA